ncbi:hypothetical protein [Aeromonas sp. Y311-2]|jgi:hypothetical protein|uniref:hypothetical protein n=1 Tax=Aeromonas sp. Y311-2 TaxID=2990507 RepID=UPI0022E32DA9|nr:hypothetical protein [Aeromonas sp. Y311-2]
MEKIDYLIKFRRAKTLDTLEIMVDRAIQKAASVCEKANVVLAGEARELELLRAGEPIWM